jgi:RND family efflux transporter MFP subunit
MKYLTASAKLRKAWLVGAGLLLLGPATAQTVADLPFGMAVVESAQAPMERVYDGRVEAVYKATMSAQTSGRIADVFFDVDDYVESGEAIVRFTDTEQQSALRGAEAALAEALALQTQTEEEYRRVAGLLESGTTSKREYDRALAGRDAAAARVTAARSSVDTAKQQLEYTLVRAPYAGIVTERHVEVGEAVTVGQPLMSGLSLESLRVVVNLPQQVAAKVREFGSAVILTDEGRVAATKLTIFPFADSASNTFTVRVDLPPGRFALYPGMFVKAAFIVGDADRLLVPANALVRRSEVSGVYVVTSDLRVRFRQVRVGNNFGEKIEVLAGLEEGESIALDPVRAGIYLKSMVATKDDD